jgi:hypothetical protein
MTGPKKEDRESTNEVRDFSITSRLQLQHQKKHTARSSRKVHTLTVPIVLRNSVRCLRFDLDRIDFAMLA